MATTFNWIYLGNSATSLDPVEKGGGHMENASSFVGHSYGSAGNPLYSHIISATMNDTTGTAGVMDVKNSTAFDTFTTNTGSGTQTYSFDGVANYNATITYADGTTATVTAVIAQDTAGNLYLAPEISANALSL